MPLIISAPGRLFFPLPLDTAGGVPPGRDPATEGPVQIEAAAAAGAVQRFAHKIQARTALKLKMRIHFPQREPAAGHLRLLPAAGGQALKAPVLGGVGQLLPLPGAENGGRVAVPQPGAGKRSSSTAGAFGLRPGASRPDSCMMQMPERP